MNEDEALKEIRESLRTYKRIVDIQRNSVEVAKAGMKIQEETIKLMERANVAQQEIIKDLRAQVTMLSAKVLHK